MKTVIHVLLLLIATNLFADDSPVPYQGDIQELQKNHHGFYEMRSADFPSGMTGYTSETYSGEKNTYQKDQGRHQPFHFEIWINSRNEPVALLLDAYKTSKGNIVWGKNTRIITAGAKYYPQLADLPNSDKIFGHDVDFVHFTGKDRMSAFGENSTATNIAATENASQSFIEKSEPVAEKTGLDDLVNQGLIRPVTTEDLERWRELSLTASSQSPPVAAASRSVHFLPFPYNGYVILRKITLPAGLYDENSATFFLEKGVPYPDGDLGDSTLYNFNDMSCQGAECDMY